MTAPIDSYLQIRSAGAVGHLPSGELVYLGDATGIVQLYRVAADGLHDQLTFGRERVTGAVVSPSEAYAVIGRDAGGDERHQLHRVATAHGAELALTDDPAAMHVLGAFSPDGGQVAFTHTGRNGTDFDVAVVAVDGTGRRELAAPGGYCVVVDWSDAGILAVRANAPFDHDLLLVDATTGEVEGLTPHTEPTAFESARLLADGSVLCASDAGSEFTRLARVAGGAVELLTPDDADVEGVALDATRSRRAWTVNRAGSSQLWVDGQLVAGLAEGTYGRPILRADGGVTITVAAADDTTDVWSLPGPARRTRSAAGGLARESLVRPTLHEVESFDGLSVPYFLFGERGRPTLCWVHGGPEGQFRPGMFDVIQYLCARGITVAAPNVRGSTGYGRSYCHLDDIERRLDSVHDLACLARELGAGSGVPVAVMGGSYGGYMTMAAITEHPELWAAAVNIVGIVNFVTFLERTGSYRRALREAEYGSLERDRELLVRLSPIHHVDRIQAPLMVIHGANDPRVPIGEADQLVTALRERSHHVEYLRYDDEGHGIKRLQNRLECYPRVAAFLEQHLGLT